MTVKREKVTQYVSHSAAASVRLDSRAFATDERMFREGGVGSVSVSGKGEDAVKGGRL